MSQVEVVNVHTCVCLKYILKGTFLSCFLKACLVATGLHRPARACLEQHSEKKKDIQHRCMILCFENTTAEMFVFCSDHNQRLILVTELF